MRGDSLFKKGDIIVALVILLIFITALFSFGLFKTPGKTVTVKENNSLVYKGKLSTEKEIKLTGNTVVIKEGYAFVSDADCKDKICKNHRKISKEGESIICLPNRVIVEIE